MTDRILGFIGTGVMGSSMAGHLILLRDMKSTYITARRARLRSSWKKVPFGKIIPPP